MPLSTHLAEMPEELRLLRDRDGPLADSSKNWAPGTTNGSRSVLARPIMSAKASYETLTG